MEPERKIEKLLRAYAKKRRANPGDAFKLHPATRRLLQAEVARNKSKPDVEESDVSLWELFRRRWAFLTVFALMIFFGAAIFIPTLSSAKKKAQSLTAMNSLKQIGVAAQMAAEENNGKLPISLDALTNQLGSDKMLTDAESGRRFVYVAGGENLDDLPSNVVLAYSPTDKKERPVLFADGRVAVIKRDEFSVLTNRGLSQMIAATDSPRRQLGEAPATMTVARGNAAAEPSVAGQLQSAANRDESKLAAVEIEARSNVELAANKPAAPPAAFDRLAKEQDAAAKDFATKAGSGQFASAASQSPAFGVQNSFKNTVAPARKPAPVLANFQVQQNGNAIRVVDEDGSIYDGAVLPENGVAQTPPALAAPAEVITGTPQQNEKTKDIASRDDSQAAQNYSFRVSGLNQTLKQNVVFTGNLQAISNSAMNVKQSLGVVNGLAGSGGGGAGGPPQSAFAQQPLWSNSRISGTAVIADTNQIEINAVPLSP